MCCWNIVSIRGSDKWEIVRCTVSFYAAQQRRVLTHVGLSGGGPTALYLQPRCTLCVSRPQRTCIIWSASLKVLAGQKCIQLTVLFASTIPKHASTCDLKHTLSFPFSSTFIPEHCCVSAQSETAGGSMHLLGLGRQKKKHMSQLIMISVENRVSLVTVDVF